MEKQEKKERKLLTENRMATINKRETSLEGLVSQFENGEDGIYNLITDNKNTIFKPKISITKQDLREVPYLQDKRDSILYWEEKLKTATGREAFVIKSTIIELRKDQYIIKDSYRQPIQLNNITRSFGNYVALPSEEWIDEEDKVQSKGVSLCDAQIVSEILQHYQVLKNRSEGKFLGDTWYMMVDFDQIYEIAMRN